MADTEAGDRLAAVAFGLGSDGAASDDDEIGGRIAVERDDGVSVGEEPGLLVERLCTVEAAAKCQERDFHAATMIA